MSLRADLVRTIQQTRDADLTDELTADRILGLPDIAAIDRMSAGTLLMPEPMTIQFGAPSGIDQGVTRLALSAFIVGKSGPWNGDGGRWVRYRGHQIARDWSADGYVVSTSYQDHQDETRSASWLVDKYPISSIQMIDELLDVVIEHHGVPGEELVDAEIVEPVTGDIARRVLDAWRTWNRRNTENLADYDPAFAADQFAAAIDRDEVQP